MSRVRIGIIGVGNRGTQLLNGFMANQDCEIVALCDVYKPYTTRTYDDVTGPHRGTDKVPRMGERLGDCERYTDFRELLKRDDIEAVCIATPDHWHAVQTIAAFRAGKDVLVEKPLTITVHEGRRMVQVEKETGRIAGVGLNRRGCSIYRRCVEIVRSGKLGDINLAGQKQGARVAADSEKRNPTDFLLWKSDKKLGWDSPWGQGFPGWHIECSAMIRSTLGSQIDIHTGGIEHIPVHHNNEIAQSESATGKKPFARFWLHRAHLQLEGAKIAKSGGNVVYLSDIVERGYHPLALRYLLLGAHYRTSSNFTWEALGAAQTAFGKLVALRLSHADVTPGTVSQHWGTQLMRPLNDDLDTPGALAVLWEMTRDGSLSPAELLATLFYADRVLGLQLEEPDQGVGHVVDDARADDVVELLLAPGVLRQVEETQHEIRSADLLRIRRAALQLLVADH